MWMVSNRKCDSSSDNQLTPKSMVALKKAYESKHCEFLQAVSLNRSPTCCFSPSERFGRRRREVAWRDHRLLSAPVAEVESQRSFPLLFLTFRESHRRRRNEASSGRARKEGLFAERALALSSPRLPLLTHRKRPVAVVAGPHRPAPRRGKAGQLDRARPLL